MINIIKPVVCNRKQRCLLRDLHHSPRIACNFKVMQTELKRTRGPDTVRKKLDFFFNSSRVYIKRGTFREEN